MDGDGVCDDLDDCVGAFDACGICNGPGDIYECGCEDIPAGDCDCNGNQLDALGDCGGSCSADDNNDGVCDDLFGCTVSYAYNFDAEAIFNDCSCIFPPPENDCCACELDCDGNFIDPDGDGICCFEQWYLCGDPVACNYDPYCGEFFHDEDACWYPQPFYDCVGNCLVDSDNDGVCDEFDTCFGDLDTCGVCNGPGDIYECGCADIPSGDCDCEGNQLDALGLCGGTCTADADEDGVCDDDDDCVGALDACGICNGPGETFECGCAETPAGDCDCEGNQLDALGVCGGTCIADVDGDGVCDDVDDCVGAFDTCGVCNGPGDIYECGCADIPEGDCDCGGNQLDALGACGGTCQADEDGDGICDDVDDCVGAFDESGVFNVTGAVLE